MQGKFCHLTNYSLNKQNKEGYIKNEKDEDLPYGSKWSLKALRSFLR